MVAKTRLRLPPNSASRRCGRASGPAAGIAERRRAVAVAGGGTGGPAGAIAERLSAVAVGRDGAGDAAAGIAECGLILRGGENGVRQ
jgi:hypothetical protein